LPKATDLSFYNWETQTPTSTSTPNFQVIAAGTDGLLFKNKRDRKIINVDPKAISPLNNVFTHLQGDPGDNSRRIEIKTEEYTQCVIYDHVTRRKT
jgi:hypothetical protein